uniref:Mothers against decapentaplegic homolog n=1 Tax=Macrostomum lignano TaxID=282301 RepID=A0A1I8F9A2_9PLAT
GHSSSLKRSEGRRQQQLTEDQRRQGQQQLTEDQRGRRRSSSLKRQRARRQQLTEGVRGPGNSSSSLKDQRGRDSSTLMKDQRARQQRATEKSEARVAFTNKNANHSRSPLASLIGGAPHSSSVKRLVSLVRPRRCQSGPRCQRQRLSVGREAGQAAVKRLRRPELVKSPGAGGQPAFRMRHSCGCLSGDPEPGHVTACRLWRWPDLQSAQRAAALENCQMPYTARTQTELCVNPQHYTRLPLCSPAQDPVLVCRPGTPAGSSGRQQRRRSPPTTRTPRSPSVYMSEDNDGAGSEGGRIGALSPPQQQLPGQVQQQPQQPLYSVHYTEPEHWCSFITVRRSATDPSGAEPLSAWACCPNVHRQWCRACTTSNGEVHVECLSRQPIFVQSPNGKPEAELGNAATVCCRIPARLCNLCCARAPSKASTSVYARSPRCATIRIAFVKGWGSDYRRQLVTATPCWIEVHLNGPLLCLDQVLGSHGQPTY